jgi:hypothetical protein
MQTWSRNSRVTGRIPEAEHPRDGARGVGEVGEVGHPRSRRLSRRKKAQRELGHHREGPLAPAQQAREVIARDVLDEASAAADHLSRGEHGLDAEHVVAGDPVLQGPQPARALGDVAADRRGGLAAGIGGEQQVLRGGSLGQLDGADSWLADRHEVVAADLLELVHARQHEHDPTVVGHRAAAQVGSGPAGTTGIRRSLATLRISATSSVPAGKTTHSGVPRSSGVGVGRERVQRAGVGANVVAADDRFEPGDEGVGWR